MKNHVQRPVAMKAYIRISPITFLLVMHPKKVPTTPPSRSVSTNVLFSITRVRGSQSPVSLSLSSRPFIADSVLGVCGFEDVFGKGSISFIVNLNCFCVCGSLKCPVVVCSMVCLAYRYRRMICDEKDVEDKNIPGGIDLHMPSSLWD